jgi:hypothetical protein
MGDKVNYSIEALVVLIEVLRKLEVAFIPPSLHPKHKTSKF